MACGRPAVTPSSQSAACAPGRFSLSTEAGRRLENALRASARVTPPDKNRSVGTERQNSKSLLSAVGSRRSIPHPPRTPLFIFPGSAFLRIAIRREMLLRDGTSDGDVRRLEIF